MEVEHRPVARLDFRASASCPFRSSGATCVRSRWGIVGTKIEAVWLLRRPRAQENRESRRGAMPSLRWKYVCDRFEVATEWALEIDPIR